MLVGSRQPICTADALCKVRIEESVIGASWRTVLDGAFSCGLAVLFDQDTHTSRIRPVLGMSLCGLEDDLTGDRQL